MGGTPIRAARRHQSRPGRSALVADDLAALSGPTHGVVELPHRLLWRPDRQVDLDHEWALTAMYETVLTEAVHVDELCAWLDGPTLIRVWNDLYLPRGVRRAWEDHHPVLRQVATAA
ncbi:MULTISPECIES: hypothetical protein [unclassified Micromonospora]|uniref:hypothetical protein n=1 Tax=unclassified Micromonospora TaxID=2617518 RepID=UPI0036324EC4